MPPRPGLLIAFEGIDGSGKTTQVRLLKEYLESRLSREVLSTKEPTDSPWGREIKQARFVGERGEGPTLTPEEEARLFTQDRRDHVARTVRPALEKGFVVITDRYYYSTMAYQGALGLDPVKIREENEEFAPRPDLVVVLLMDPEAGTARIVNDRKRGLDRDFRGGYLARVEEIYANLEGASVLKIDASRDMMEVAKEIRERVDSLLR